MLKSMTPADVFTVSVGAPQGQEVFSGWASRMASVGEFRSSTVQTYAAIWNAWLSWLAARDLNWSDVDAGTIRLYLNGPSPGLAHHRPALHADRMANFTQQRYWRVLRAVYAEAVRTGVLKSNPVLEVPEAARPAIHWDSRWYQVLPPGLLAQLRDPAVIEECIPYERKTQWWAVRDRALMLVLAHLGLTTRELMGLRGCDALPSSCSSASPVGLPCPGSSDLGVGPVALAVPKDGDLLSRTLELNAPVICALQSWLVVRREVLGFRLSRRVGANAVSDGLLDQVCRSEPLFMSRQRSSAQITADRSDGSVESVEALGLLPAMEASNVYSLVKRCLDALYCQPGMAGQHPKLRGLNQATGAAIIRNTVLVEWVQNLGEEAAVLLGGLQSVSSLRVASGR